MVQGCKQSKGPNEITHDDNKNINGLVKHVAHIKA